MSKKIHFISGLPRSGSTLLCNILAQNPKFHSTATSGILDILVLNRNQWDIILEMRAMPHIQAELKKGNVIKSILNGYFEDVAEEVVFDKSRGWLAYLELANSILGRPAKVLVPVRKIEDVLTSFEKLYRQNISSRPLTPEQSDFARWQTVEGRCEVWCDHAQPVGLAYNRIKDALHRGLKDQIHFVEYEKLTADPTDTMRLVYEFLNEPYFQHDFDNVIQVTQEDDYVHGIPDLHTIRPKVQVQPSQSRDILGEAANKYRGLELW